MLSFELKVHNAMLFYNLSPYLAHIFIKAPGPWNTQTSVKSCKVSLCLLIEITEQIEMQLKVPWYKIVNWKFQST